jgi:CTP:molybdopterin cytidylyltransferase MocA
VRGPSGVSAIVLAAGGGSRFGGGKLLAKFGGRPIIEAVLDNLREAPVDEIIAVVGADAERLREVCERHSVRTVANEEWEWGQSTSVVAGLRASGGRAAVVLLGDQPFVGAEAVARLVAAFAEGAKVAVATYGGKRRNPVLFSREIWPLLKAELAGDEGARSFLRRHPELVVEVPCDGVGDPVDVDTREDLRRLEEMRGIVGGYKMAEGRKSRPKNVR